MLNFKIGSRELLKQVPIYTATWFASDLMENFVKMNPATSFAFDFTKKFVKLNSEYCNLICIWFDGKFRHLNPVTSFCILLDEKIREIEYCNLICIWSDGKFRQIESCNFICIWFDGKICHSNWILQLDFHLIWRKISSNWIL